MARALAFHSVTLVPILQAWKVMEFCVDLWKVMENLITKKKYELIFIVYHDRQRFH